jgi:hypothetical protein
LEFDVWIWPPVQPINQQQKTMHQQILKKSRQIMTREKLCGYLFRVMRRKSTINWLMKCEVNPNSSTTLNCSTVCHWRRRKPNIRPSASTASLPVNWFLLFYRNLKTKKKFF